MVPDPRSGIIAIEVSSAGAGHVKDKFLIRCDKGRGLSKIRSIVVCVFCLIHCQTFVTFWPAYSVVRNRVLHEPGSIGADKLPRLQLAKMLLRGGPI